MPIAPAIKAQLASAATAPDPLSPRPNRPGGGLIQNDDTWTSWVMAAPFRAWLTHLSASTGFEPLTIAVAAGVPTGVARSLARGGLRPRRIRAVDAVGLLAWSIDSLQAVGDAPTDATPAHDALVDLGAACPSPTALATRLQVSTGTARGLLEGWMVSCPRSVLWRCLALAQEITYQRTLTQIARTRACPGAEAKTKTKEKATGSIRPNTRPGQPRDDTLTKREGADKHGQPDLVEHVGA